MFTERLATARAQVEARLLAKLEGGDALTAAMRHAVIGGKGLRGFLVLESAALHGVAAEDAIVAAAAVEARHAYSLIQDDLPAMDDDDLRRGQPTVHVKWDEATAILAGDALQALAFELLASAEAPADVRVALAASLALASGRQGMVRGQMQDIEAERSGSLSLDQITDLQANKTGALIRWSAEAGAVIARTDPAPLRAYATSLGLAFQIADDILDVEGDEATAGKRLHKDENAGKATFVSLLGLEGAKARAKDLVTTAEDALTGYGAAADILRQAARFVIARKN
jgi:farnesyl diphosphate synthase